MEEDKKLQYILMAAAVVIFGFSYAVGYFVGKETGFKGAEQKFNVEKQKLLKTIATLSPVSRPTNKREVYVVDKTAQGNRKSVAQKSGQNATKVNTEVAVNNGTQKEVTPKTQAPSVKKAPTLKEIAKGNATSKIQKQVKKTATANVQPPKTVARGRKYFLQVGIFKNKGNAVKLASQLEKKKFKTKTVFYNNRSVVIVGYFNNESTAFATQRLLKKAGYFSILKWRN